MDEWHLKCNCCGWRGLVEEAFYTDDGEPYCPCCGDDELEKNDESV